MDFSSVVSLWDILDMEGQVLKDQASINIINCLLLARLFLWLPLKMQKKIKIKSDFGGEWTKLWMR